ncbi:hypothetical protein BH24CHL2_BH24CHL2_0410 [soil metagenome]
MATLNHLNARSLTQHRKSTWWSALRGWFMAEYTNVEGDAFIWRRGRDSVILRQQSEGWHVCYRTTGRLLGPPRCVYEAHHRIAKHAAWDMMARVINVSRDEHEGVEAARMAARWMRQMSG